MLSGPTAFQAKVAVTPPIIAAAAPSFVARRQKTPPTTGMKKDDAMRAVNRSTMNWTSSPSPTPLRRRITGAAPTRPIPMRSTRTFVRSSARGLIRLW